MIDREQLKCYPELMALIEQEHTLEQVESISIFQDTGSYVDEHGFVCHYHVGGVEITITFTDGTKITTDLPVLPEEKSE